MLQNIPKKKCKQKLNKEIADVFASKRPVSETNWFKTDVEDIKKTKTTEHQ